MKKYLKVGHKGAKLYINVIDAKCYALLPHGLIVKVVGEVFGKKRYGSRKYYLIIWQSGEWYVDELELMTLTSVVDKTKGFLYNLFK